jgi:hypothetical protein
MGLAEVRAPIVMFPDDDSLWWPGTVEALMRVYERDSEVRIGAVCAAEATEAPPGTLSELRRAYRMTPTERLKQAVAHSRAKAERAAFPDPFILHGRSYWPRWERPDWFLEDDVVPVEWMTGFRMSFRTDAIRARGFDETLTGYALFEDVDASYTVMRDYMVVGARNAQVYHYKAPGRRTNGVAAGATQLLNRAYVICKHSVPGSIARRRLMRYGRYKLTQYLGSMHTAYGRDRANGALRALRAIPSLVAAAPDELPSIYRSLRDQCLGGPAPTNG